MKPFRVAAVLCLLSSAALAQNQLPKTVGPSGPVYASPSAIVSPAGAGPTCVIGATGCALPVTVTSDASGGATAANQATQITAENLTNTTLGAVTASPAANTISDRLKTINTTLGTPLQAGGSVVVTSAPTTAVTGTFWQATQPVSGTFWQATQPVSAAALPLPTGAATAAGLTTINTTLGTPFQAGGSIGNTAFGITGALPAGTNVIGHVIIDTGSTTAVTGTVAVSAASLPLPTGSATAAKQPALGTAGSSSTDVLSVQGIASGTPLPVSGTVAIGAGSANIGVVSPLGATSTDSSSTVTVGNTFQTVFASSGSRKGCTIQNPIAATETLFVAFVGSPTTAKAFGLAPGAAIQCSTPAGVVLTDTVTVTAATTGHAFVAISQ